MKLDEFLLKLEQHPEQIEFSETMAVIEANYQFNPTRFSNGDLENEAGQNNGSCKIFAFGMMHYLSEEQTLACFGDYYRKDVLGNPEADDHQNIRNFINTGWEGIRYEGFALLSQ